MVQVGKYKPALLTPRRAPASVGRPGSMRAAGAFSVTCCSWLLLPCAAAATAAPRVDCDVLTSNRIDARREGLWCYDVPLQV